MIKPFHELTATVMASETVYFSILYYTFYRVFKFFITHVSDFYLSQLNVDFTLFCFDFSYFSNIY